MEFLQFYCKPSRQLFNIHQTSSSASSCKEQSCNLKKSKKYISCFSAVLRNFHPYHSNRQSIIFFQITSKYWNTQYVTASTIFPIQLQMCICRSTEWNWNWKDAPREESITFLSHSLIRPLFLNKGKIVI